TPRSEAYFVFPLAQGTPGKQCGLAATGVYQPSLRSPWLAAQETCKPCPQPFVLTRREKSPATGIADVIENPRYGFQVGDSGS
ncbi:hypothetical protein, partial [Thiolapillus sp.]|uniref:hypothetical protein n=1 Tax=Thiolapillus sp. TaxID=2017437 RepID=UPI0025D4AEE1